MNQNRYAPPTAPVADLPGTGRLGGSTVLLAARLLWAALVIGVVNTALQWNVLTATAPMKLVVSVLIVTFAVLGLLAYNIACGRNWARIVLLVLAILGLPSLLQLPAAFARAPISGALSVLQTLLQCASLYIVFFTSARHAFSKRINAQQSVQPDGREDAAPG